MRMFSAYVNASWNYIIPFAGPTVTELAHIHDIDNVPVQAPPPASFPLKAAQIAENFVIHDTQLHASTMAHL